MLNKRKEELGMLIFIEKRRGYYLYLLSTVSGQKTHIVGIDCFKGEVYDCMESNKLKVSLDTLNYCTGKNVGGLFIIYVCMELVKAL